MKQTTAKDVRSRLRSIEGQVKGLIEMIDNDRSSEEILIQVLAVRAAIGSVGLIVISEHIDGLAGSPDMSKKSRDKLSAIVTSFLT